MKKIKNKLPVVGRNTLIEIIGHTKDVPAKVDTGADSSAIWASNVRISKKGNLYFTLFGENSKYYTGEVIKRKAFKVASVRSSSGHEEMRYRVEMPVRVAGKRLRASFYLADRSKNDFPILLGRRTLNKKFLVDVSAKQHLLPPKEKKGYYEEMIKDPYAFYKKYTKVTKTAKKVKKVKKVVKKEAI